MGSTSLRRIVAGIGEDGRSRVVLDSHAEAAGFGATTITQLWTGQLDAVVDSNSAIADETDLFRFEQLAEPRYAFMAAEYAPGLGSDDPGMHATNTIDHFHVIEGEVVLVLESEEVTLRAGDSGICRGVIHGWRNDAKTAAKLVTFILPATPVHHAP